MGRISIYLRNSSSRLSGYPVIRISGSPSPGFPDNRMSCADKSIAVLNCERPFTIHGWSFGGNMLRLTQ